MSTTDTTFTLSDEQLTLINPVLDHYQQSAYSESNSERLRTFLRAAARVHPEPPTEAFLEYFLSDPIEGRAFLEQYGVDGTHAQMKEFVQGALVAIEAIADGTISATGDGTISIQ
jgi:hypothetical protein